MVSFHMADPDREVQPQPITPPELDSLVQKTQLPKDNIEFVPKLDDTNWAGETLPLDVVTLPDDSTRVARAVHLDTVQNPAVAGAAEKAVEKWKEEHPGSLKSPKSE